MMQKPWVAVPATPDNLAKGREFSLPTVTVGLRVFLGVVTVLFTLLVISYFDRREFADLDLHSRGMPKPNGRGRQVNSKQTVSSSLFPANA